MGKGQGPPGRRVQLHRAVSKLGWGSRTQAWDWVRAGQICVDGRVVRDPLAWVDIDRQQLTRHGSPASREPPTPLTLALHKPRGVITTRQDERGRSTVYDLLPPGLPWLLPVGRLDADSEGLLILTTDHALSVQLTDPKAHVSKRYQVTVRGLVPEHDLARLSQGVELADGPTRPAEVHVLAADGLETMLEVVLTEGRNRQIRRMLAAVGRKVRRLVRVAIGDYQLGDLPSGQTRPLDAADLRLLVGRHSSS